MLNGGERMVHGADASTANGEGTEAGDWARIPRSRKPARAMAELTSVRETLKSLASRTEALRGYL